MPIRIFYIELQPECMICPHVRSTLFGKDVDLTSELLCILKFLRVPTFVVPIKLAKFAHLYVKVLLDSFWLLGVFTQLPNFWQWDSKHTCACLFEQFL